MIDITQRVIDKMGDAIISRKVSQKVYKHEGIFEITHIKTESGYESRST
ncbi:MAG: hypothetical protein RMJ51_05765 [Candidatus Calescibacterium sp.]|nr:hypothetical protein [Candidatus Calescibacterium sp.]MCX7972383.1 hypothetical protein [bacterium]MDW8195726.1 hypothetical protein [Candidatus Calescibacterium sp.]